VKATFSFGDPFENYRYFEATTALPNRTRTEGGYHEAYFVVARYPFLDKGVVELSLRLSPSLLIRFMRTKYMVRKLLEEMSFPASITRRPKFGFLSPLKEWYRRDLKFFVTSILLDKGTLQRGCFRKVHIEKILREHSEGKRDHSTLIGNLLNFELWCRVFIDGNMEDNVKLYS